MPKITRKKTDAYNYNNGDKKTEYRYYADRNSIGLCSRVVNKRSSWLESSWDDDALNRIYGEKVTGNEIDSYLMHDPKGGSCGTKEVASVIEYLLNQ